DREVHQRPEKVADAEMQRRDFPLPPVALGDHRVDERHHHVRDERADDLSERAADDDGDGQIDDILLVDELPELFQHLHGAGRVARTTPKPNRHSWATGGTVGRPRREDFCSAWWSPAWGTAA